MSLCDLHNEINEIHKKNKPSYYFDDDFWGGTIFKTLWTTRWRSSYPTGLRYCPLCLIKDEIPFFRKIWRLRYITFCSTHNCLLENKCPHCNAPIAPYNLKWDMSLKNCYKCQKDLSHQTPYLLRRRDKLLKISKSFLENPKTNNNMIYEVFSNAWSISRSYNLSDKIFQNHPLTKDKELNEIWNGIENKIYYDKRYLFSNSLVL